MTGAALPISPNDIPGTVARSHELLRNGEADAARRLLFRALDFAPQNGLLLSALSESAFVEEDEAQAIEIAENAVSINPMSVEAWLHLASMLVRLRRLDDADAKLALALKHLPDDPALLVNQSELAAWRGEDERALQQGVKAHRASACDAPWARLNLVNLRMRRGEFDEADKLLLEGLRAIPGNALFLIRRSDLARKRGESAAALALAEAACASEPTLVWSWIHLSDLQMEAGRVQQAIEAAETAHRLMPDNHHVLRLLSDLAERDGNLAAALAWARESQRASPKASTAWIHLYQILSKSDRTDEARQVECEMMSTFQNDCDLLRHLSVKANERGNSAEALSLAYQAVDADPTQPWAQFHLSVLLLEAGRPFGADKAGELALRFAAGNPYILMQISKASRSHGDPARALEFAKLAVSVNPCNEYCHLHYSLLCTELRDAETAMSAVESGLAAIPTSSVLLRRLGELLSLRNDHAEAEKALRRAIAVNKRDVFAYIQYANLLVQQSRSDDAEKVIRAALTLLPDRSELQSSLSDLVFRKGDVEDAVRLARLATTSDPKFPWGWLQLSNALLKQGKLAECEGAAREALKLLPQNPYALLHLSQITALQGLLDKAVAFSEHACAANPGNSDFEIWNHALKSQRDAAQQLAEVS